MTELTDLEICKRIAEIEGFEFEVKALSVVTEKGVWPKVPFKDVGMSLGSSSYDPLTDDALCFKLIERYKIDITYYPYLVEASYNGHFWEAKDLKVAVCLVLIEANNER